MKPWVPGWAEVMRGDDSSQHCDKDAPNAAAVTVALSFLAAEEDFFDGGRRVKVAEMREVSEEDRRMGFLKKFLGDDPGLPTHWGRNRRALSQSNMPVRG